MIYPLLIPEPPIHVLPALAEAVGFREAAVIQTIHYWLNPYGDALFRDNLYWVANLSDRLLHRFFFWDLETVEELMAQLERSGVLIAFEDSGTQTYHTIDYDHLEEMIPVSNHILFTPFMQDAPPLQKANANSRPSFTADVQRKGDAVYTMTAQDPKHFLACELVLEVAEAALPRNVICHFPTLSDTHFRTFVWGDATLYETLMSMFHLNICKQLLLFCIKHQASSLIIFTDDMESEGLNLYRDFLIHQNRSSSDREKSEIVIPADQETFEAWIDFMETTLINLRQTLWRDHKTNAAIAHYLRSYDGTLL